MNAKTELNTDDFKGLPHIVIFRDEHSVRIVQFTGENAMEDAHATAMQGFEGCVTVAVRVRQICPARLEHLMR